MLKYLKISNVAWLAVLLVSVYWLICQLPTDLIKPWQRPFLFGIWMWLLQYTTFLDNVNSFNTDVQSAALMLLTVCWMVAYAKTKAIQSLVLTGLGMGLIALTKASFFYSGLGVCIAAMVYQWAQKQSLQPVIIVLFTLLTVTAPWLVRNQLMTGQAVISGRGPETFVDRTYEEIWNDKHAYGLFYAYSPDFLRPLATKLTGYGVQDRLKGGRLQHSTRAHNIDLEARKANDETMAINTHFKAWIWIGKVYEHFYSHTHNPVIAKKLAAKTYQAFAMRQMLAHPVRHLKFTLIFAWRGMWMMNGIDGRTQYEMGWGKRQPMLKEAIGGLGLMAILAMFLHGFIYKNRLLLAITALPLALYAFQSFFSHNLPRYSMQLVPGYILACLVLLCVAKQYYAQKRGKGVSHG